MDNSNEQRRGPLRRFVNRLEVDRAVFYSLLLRGWQLAGGAVSVLLISVYFTRELQGYYYTFSSLLALQALFDLGLGSVVIIIASHEWSKLQLDDAGRIAGDPQARSRLVSFGRLLFRWYGVAAVLFTACVGTGGALFLAGRPGGEISWVMPWIALVVLTAPLLWMLPFTALLEGCGQIIEVSRFQVIQAVITNLAVWAALALGANLWVIVAGAATRLIVLLLFLAPRAKRFFSAFWTPPTGEIIAWKADIWPLQWRQAVTAVGAYFALSVMTPVMFHYHGPVVAGQMGMTWTLLTVLQNASLAWVTARFPRFGHLIANRDFKELDRIFWRLTIISLGVIALGSVCLAGLIAGLAHLQFRLGERLLPLGPTAVFLVGLVGHHFAYCQAYYIHAHKRDPLVFVHAAGYLVTGAAVWGLGRWLGPMGVALGYTAVIWVVMVPTVHVIWLRFRHDYRREPAE